MDNDPRVTAAQPAGWAFPAAIGKPPDAGHRAKERVMKRLIMQGWAVLTVALAIAGCARKDDAATGKADGGKTVVRYATIGVNEASLPLYLGIKKGFFAQQGIELQIHDFPGGVEAVTAGAAHEIDIGGVGSPIVVGAAAGVPIKIVGSPVEPGQRFVVVSRPDYKTFKELKGKKVSGGKPGQGTIQAFVTIARANGLQLSDFQNVDAGLSSGAYAALQSGQIEAFLTTELVAAKAEIDGVGKVLVRAEDYFGRYQHTFFFATDRFIAEKPQAVKGFLAGYRNAVAYVKAHPEEAIAFGIKELKLEEKPLRQVLVKELPHWDESGKVDLIGTNNTIRILKELGELDKSVKVSAEQLVDARFQTQ
jgi:NitT/TauT family transport system substrate-binding protein